MVELRDPAPAGLPFANCRPPYEEGRQVKPQSKWLLREDAARRLFLLRLRGYEDRDGASLFAREPEFSTGLTYPDSKNFGTLLVALSQTNCARHKKQENPSSSIVIDGRLIQGFVSFSLAPPPGILTEVARLDANQILREAVREEIAAGRI